MHIRCTVLDLVVSGVRDPGPVWLFCMPVVLNFSWCSCWQYLLSVLPPFLCWSPAFSTNSHFHPKPGFVAFLFDLVMCTATSTHSTLTAQGCQHSVPSKSRITNVCTCELLYAAWSFSSWRCYLNFHHGRTFLQSKYSDAVALRMSSKQWPQTYDVKLRVGRPRTGWLTLTINLRLSHLLYHVVTYLLYFVSLKLYSNRAPPQSTP